MMPNLISNEPIQASTIVVIIAWLSAHFALNLDDTTATAIALVVLALSQWVARNLSVPLKKHDKIVKTVAQAAKTP